MTDRAVNELQTGLNGTGTDLSDSLDVTYALNLSVCAELKIYSVGLVNSFLNEVFSDKIGQITADLIAQRQRAVRECACAGKSGRDVAVRLAVHTFLGLCFGTMPVLDGLTFFDNDDLFLCALAKHLNGSENTGRSGSDDYNICFHFPDTSENNKNRAFPAKGLMLGIREPQRVRSSRINLVAIYSNTLLFNCQVPCRRLLLPQS